MQPVMIDSRIILPALVCVVLGAGCSSERGPKLAAVDGIVNYQGRPIAGATVVFVPEKGPVAMGVTDHSGKFVLSTGTSKGVVIGPVKATIVASAGGPSDALDGVASQPKSQAEADAYMKKAAEMQQSIAEGRGKDVLPISLIPEKYGKTETSGLSYTIKANGDNHFTIEL